MFSNRLPEDLSENALTQRAGTLRSEGALLIDLTLSDPTRAGLALSREALQNIFGQVDASGYDPHPRGLLSAREAIAAYYASAGRRVHPDDLFCTSSTSEAYSLLFKLHCSPGDAVCIPQPAYPLFSWLTALDGVAVRPYLLRRGSAGRWHIDMTSLDVAMGEGCKAVVVVNPANPAGNYLRPDERAQLDQLCAKRGAALIVDEVFYDYPLTDAERCRTAGADGEALCYTLNGFSKLIGLPQVKLGWIAVAGATPLREKAKRRLDLIADTYLSAGTVPMAAADALLTHRVAVQERIVSRCRENLRGAAARLGESLLQPEGGWSAVLRLPEECDEEEWALQLLERHHVLLHPGYLFDFPIGAHAVISLLPDSRQFTAAVAKIAET